MMFLRKSAIATFFRRHQSTIYALSSGHGKCGVAVIRISGSDAEIGLERMTSNRRAEPRKAELRTIIHPTTKEKLDKALTLWFPSPASFTGEDCVELHVHGGVAVIKAVFEALASFEGFRHAEPGEFTRRAFLAGKLDLSQVEGLADLIHAETEAQRKVAMKQMDGDVGKVFENWRERIMKLLAHLEAFIDFSESEEVEDDVLSLVIERARTLEEEIGAHIAEASTVGERVRHGVKIAILGEPNVGKSSFLNALMKRPAAIVSDVAGTTRDVLEMKLDLGGYPAVIVDTAGLRRGQIVDVVEREGVKRAVSNANEADLIVFMLEASNAEDDVNLRMESKLKEFGIDNPMAVKTIVVNKTDLLIDNATTLQKDGAVFVSCKTKYGLPELFALLEKQVHQLCTTSAGCNPTITHVRQVSHLRKSQGRLEDFRMESSGDLAIMGHHLRAAVRELGHVTGKIHSEQILDIIFADFCIGK